MGLVAKRLSLMGEEVVEIGKGMATNRNGLRVELELKNFKAQSNEIGVVVHVNKVAVPHWTS